MTRLISNSAASSASCASRDGFAGLVVERVQAPLFAGHVVVTPVFDCRWPCGLGCVGPRRRASRRAYGVRRRARTVTFTVSPGLRSSTRCRESSGCEIVLPSIATILSPLRRPALAAGPPGLTVPTTAPARRGRSPLRDAEIGAVDLAARPRAAARRRLTVSTGTAKPTPELASPPLVAICELTPITRPSASSSGPPELPGLIAASVCTAPEIVKPLGAWISRPSAETMPLGDGARRGRTGVPMAIAASPGRSAARRRRAQRLERRPGPCSGSIFSTARSVDGSLPTSLAGIGLPFVAEADA